MTMSELHRTKKICSVWLRQLSISISTRDTKLLVSVIHGACDPGCGEPESTNLLVKRLVFKLTKELKRKIVGNMVSNWWAYQFKGANAKLNFNQNSVKQFKITSFWIRFSSCKGHKVCSSDPCVRKEASPRQWQRLTPVFRKVFKRWRSKI